jgi:hypothetical protein
MTPAEQAYSLRHSEAMALLEQLQESIENMPAPDGDTPINWGHVGSIRHVSAKLKYAVGFLNGEDVFED